MYFVILIFVLSLCLKPSKFFSKIKQTTTIAMGKEIKKKSGRRYRAGKSVRTTDCNLPGEHTMSVCSLFCIFAVLFCKLLFGKTLVYTCFPFLNMYTFVLIKQFFNYTFFR